MLHACQFYRAAFVGVVECVVADGFQRGRKGNVSQRYAVIEGFIADILKSLRQLQQRQILMVLERLGADRLHRNAADGFGNRQIGGKAVVCNDSAGGGVEVKIFLGKAVVFHDHGVFAAGLDFQFDTSLFKRRRIRFQLIVRNVCRRALADETEALLVDDRADAFKGDLFERTAKAERVRADIAHTRRNGDFAQRVAGVEIHSIDDNQALRQGDAFQVFTPCNGVAPQLKHGFRQCQRCDRIRFEHVDVDHIHRIAFQLSGNHHIAAFAFVTAKDGVVCVVLPFAGFSPCRHAERQHQQRQNQTYLFLHHSIPPFLFFRGSYRPCIASVFHSSFLPYSASSAAARYAGVTEA